MTTITLTVSIAYVLLIVFTLFLDPKGKKDYAKRRYSIFHLLLFSTLKMLLAISLVVVVALINRVDPGEVVGLSGSSFTPSAIGFGLIAAFGFLAIYLIWQLIVSRTSKKAQSAESTSGLIDLLPKSWLPLISVFMIISFEAGLLEEIFFRGIVQSHLNVFFTASCAAVVGGVLFGIAHFYQGISGILGTSVLGIWLGVTYAATGNLLVPVMGHFLGDFACMMIGARQVIEHKKRQQ